MKDNIMKDNIMKDEIVSIEEFVNKNREGFKITTTNHIFEISIDAGYQCCEDYGYMVTECDIRDFIGSDIKSVECVVGSDYAKRLIEFANSKEIEVESCCFLIFETSHGTLDFAIYNMHNGFYEHRIYITKTLIGNETITKLSSSDWL